MKCGSKSLLGVVRDMAHDGSAVVETDQGVVLCAGAQPEERVRIKLVNRRRGVWRAKLLEVLEPAESRVDAFCPELERCGGCQWGAIDLRAQRAIKRRWVAEAVGLPVERVEMKSGAGTGYRRRARWAWKERKGKVAIGYRAPRSREVVGVSQCPILVTPLLTALETLRRELGAELRGAGEIEALASDERVGLFVRTADPQTSNFYLACEGLAKEKFHGVVAQVQDVAPAVFGARSMALRVRTARGECQVHTPIGGFAQGNSELNDVLVESVLDACPERADTVVDLFAGSGNLTLPLTALAPSQMWVVESDAAALEASRQNVAELVQARPIKTRFLGADVQSITASLPPKLDVLVLDPPREGAGAAVMQELSRRKIARLVYVSCNPATLKRDLRHLGGYEVVRATALDLFPQTPHVESVAVLAPQG